MRPAYVRTAEVIKFPRSSMRSERKPDISPWLFWGIVGLMMVTVAAAIVLEQTFGR